MKLADGSVGDVACLKRVVAPDKEALGIVRTEVDTMVGFLEVLLIVETTERTSTCGHVHRLTCVRVGKGRIRSVSTDGVLFWYIPEDDC
jgi:hypothetical protein